MPPMWLWLLWVLAMKHDQWSRMGEQHLGEMNIRWAETARAGLLKAILNDVVGGCSKNAPWDQDKVDMVMSNGVRVRWLKTSWGGRRMTLKSIPCPNRKTYWSVVVLVVKQYAHQDKMDRYLINRACFSKKDLWNNFATGEIKAPLFHKLRLRPKCYTFRLSTF